MSDKPTDAIVIVKGAGAWLVTIFAGIGLAVTILGALALCSALWG